jgi:C1A family cysteine protease
MPLHRYTWRPSPPDPRNIVTALTDEEVAAAPAEFDPTGHFLPAPSGTLSIPSVIDQLQIGSCTANAFRTTLLRALIAAGISPQEVSRLHIYGGERTIEGTFPEDSGAIGHDAFKFARKQGVAYEPEWPYGDGSTFAAEADYKHAQAAEAKYFVDQYSHPHPDEATFKAVLSGGKYIAFGFTVYTEFESAEVATTGVVPLPKRGERVLGGHEVVAVGYLILDGKLYFICQNSWGTGWGKSGFFLFPAEYLFGYGTSDWRCIDSIR